MSNVVSTENNNADSRGSLLGEFWKFIWENKIWWMAPTLLILGFLTVVILLTSGSSITPFFYALF